MHVKPSFPILNEAGSTIEDNLLLCATFSDRIGTQALDISGQDNHLSDVAFDSWGSFLSYTTPGDDPHYEYGVLMEDGVTAAVGPTTFGGSNLNPSNTERAVLWAGRVDGDGSLVSMTDQATTTNRMFQIYASGGQIYLRLGGSVTSVTGGTFSPGDFVSIAVSFRTSGGTNGQAAISKNWGTATLGTAITPASAAVNETGVPLRVSSRGDGAGGESFFGQGYAAIVAIFDFNIRDSTLTALAENPYSFLKDKAPAHMISQEQAAQMGLDSEVSTLWFGDSHTTPQVTYRHPTVWGLDHVDQDKFLAYYAHVNVDNATVGSSTTQNTLTNTTRDSDNLQNDGALPSNLAAEGLVAAPWSMWTCTGDVADDGVLIDTQIWETTRFGGQTPPMFFQVEDDVFVRFLFAIDSADTLMASLEARLTSGSNALNTTINLSVASGQSRVIWADAQSPSPAVSLERLHAILRTTAVDETGQVLINMGCLFFRREAMEGNGYTFTALGNAGWSTGDWSSALVNGLGLGWFMGALPIPRIIRVLLGHNQETGETTQLDAGNLTGDFTNNTNDLADAIELAIRVARNMQWYWGPVSVEWHTPWRSTVASQMNDATNANTVEAVHRQLCLDRGYLHVSLLEELGRDASPFPGLHVNDSVTDPVALENCRTVNAGIRSGLNKYVPSGLKGVAKPFKKKAAQVGSIARGSIAH